MIDTFELSNPTESIHPQQPAFPSMQFTAIPKSRHPKGKKATRKALKKVEKEREQLIWINGYIVAENNMLKRTMQAASAASRGAFRADLADTTLRLLPAKHKR